MVRNIDTTCYFCLEGRKTNDILMMPCECPRLVHKSCLAKWRSTKNGTTEEKYCRFCHCSYDDGSRTIPQINLPLQSAPVLLRTFRVKFNDKTHLFTLPNTDDLKEQFQTRCNQLFNTYIDNNTNLKFIIRNEEYNGNLESINSL